MAALQLAAQKYFDIKGTLGFMKFVRSPTDTETIFTMNESFKKATSPEIIAEMVKAAYQNEKIEMAFQEKYWPTMPSFEELEKMPNKSFGKSLADFITYWNLDKDLFPSPKLTDRSDYMLSRIYLEHDAWHVLTGYTPALEDELALQAFGVGQYRQPLSLLIFVGGLLHIIRNEPLKAVNAMEVAVEAFERGKDAENLIASRILERLSEPLEKVRADLNIKMRKV